ncbi:Ribosomal protein L25/L23 [Metarhizium brunneum]
MAEAAKAAARQLPGFRLGQKQVFLYDTNPPSPIPKTRHTRPLPLKLIKNTFPFAHSPNHVITFLRKEHLPPNEACFQVPLRFTKFDLRDYLWNLYNVEVTKVRSYVKQQPLTQRNSHSRSWYRPQPLKMMTVELAKPFQWPEAPTDLEPWNHELWKMREDLMEKRNEDQINQHKFEIAMRSKEEMSKERKELKGLAERMLRGEVKWDNGVALDPKWDSVLKEAQRKDAAA